MSTFKSYVTTLWQNVDNIIPVPLHPGRKRKRGFNQSEVIAKKLAGLSDTGYLKKCLIKTRNVPPQTSLTGEERRKNLKGAFGVPDKNLVEGKTLLLVDDVFTTGATLQECSRVLMTAGAKEVRAATIAQA